MNSRIPGTAGEVLTSTHPSVLIVSNGHGEDAVGMALARRLRPSATITAFPLAGTGAAYTDVILLEPRRALPSGGFGLRGSWRALWGDLRSGALGHWLAQRAMLRRQRGRYRLVVAIGDVYCLRMAAIAGAPIIFIAIAKSEHNETHRALERWLIRRHARIIFARDQVTAEALHHAGLPARYVGNPLMDTIALTGGRPPLDGTRPTVTILPGSRADAYANLDPLLQMCERIAGHVAPRFLCALAPGLDLKQVKAAAATIGWVLEGEVLHRDHVAVTLTRAFGDAVQAADVVVGLAGTANEQAAGLGKPVVTFPGPGTQATPQFVRLQKRLLGDALIVVEDGTDAAEAVVRLLGDPNERATRGNVGRQRMGEPGAVAKIAQAILELLRAPSSPTDVAGNPS